MNKSEVIEFFNRKAPDWDSEMIRSDRIIGTILNSAGVKSGVRVLDVACGTGVLFPDYLARDVASVLGIDISDAMVDIATKKTENEPRITVCLGDAEVYEFDGSFDCIVIYNAFPHFAKPDALFANLVKHLAPGGRIAIAHGASREHMNRHHAGHASRVSMELMSELELSKMLSAYVDVNIVVANDEMYLIVGQRRGD